MKRVLLVLLAACGASKQPVTPDGVDGQPVTPVACTGEPPPVGALEDTATTAWRLTASSGQADVRKAVGVDNGAVIVGTYEDGLAIAGHTLQGSGTFVARVTAAGEVTRLARISADKLNITALAPKGDALYAAMRGDETLQLARIDANDVMTILVTARGAFNYEAHVALAADDVILSGTLAFGNLAIDGGPTVTPQVPEPFHPGHGIAIRLAGDGGITAWHLDGEAGSSLAVAESPSSSFVIGRFGGFGPLEVHFGSDVDSPRLVGVSSDDDPAFDAYVAGRSGDGVSWVQRIRSYYSEPVPPPHVTYEGDLVLAIQVTARDIVFRDGESDAVTVGNDAQHALGRFAPDGTVRWAREAIQVQTLWTAGCALYGAGTDFATTTSYLARFDGDGGLVGRRTYDVPLEYRSLAVIGAGSWVLAGIDTDGRLVLTRLDW